MADAADLQHFTNRKQDVSMFAESWLKKNAPDFIKTISTKNKVSLLWKRAVLIDTAFT